MKITIDVEATPQEVRSFFGLPNIEPLQNEMVEMMRKNMVSGMEGFDPMTVMKVFLPEQSQAFNNFQQTFWKVMTGKGTHTTEDPTKDET